MVFKTHEAAEHFRKFHLIGSHLFKIIRVEPVGKKIKVSKISSLYTNNAEFNIKLLYDFYDPYTVVYDTDPPIKGSQCYPAVKVLD